MSMMKGKVEGTSQANVCSDGLVSLLVKLPHYGQKTSSGSFVRANQFQEPLWRTAHAHHAEISKLLCLEPQGDVQPGTCAAEQRAAAAEAADNSPIYRWLGTPLLATAPSVQNPLLIIWPTMADFCCDISLVA